MPEELVVGKIQPIVKGLPLDEYFRRKSRQYAKDNIVRQGGYDIFSRLNTGFAAEHFVISWLLSRQIEVADICSKQSHHDLVALIGGQWISIQVKLGAVNKKTGTIVCRATKKRIWSDIVAVVDLRSHRIKWKAGTSEVPPELIEKP